MAVASWSLISGAQLSAELQGEPVTATLEGFCDEATAICEQHTGRNLLSREYTGELRDGEDSTVLMPRHLPITSATAVTVWGTAQTIGDDPDLYDVQVYPTHLYRASGWPVKALGITLDYVAGYLAGHTDRNGVSHDSALARLRRAALIIAKALWQDTKTLRPEVQAISVAGKSLTFTVDPPIPRRAQMILDDFMRPGIG
jgi:hypothetical protein